MHKNYIKPFWKIVLPVIALMFCNSIKANDTLTRAQVYNFNVGDTFDYEITYVSQAPPRYQYGTSYERDVITGKYYSSDSDTLYFLIKIAYPNPVKIDTEILTDLQQYEIFLDIDTGPISVYGLDSSSIYNGRLLNWAYANGGESDALDSCAAGLGIVASCSYGWGDYLEGGCRNLFYYSKGGETWGTPILSDTTMRQYIPLPESCAVWTDDIYSIPLVYGTNPIANPLAITEQIRSGERIAFNGHPYIEMLYRSYNYLNGYFISDSLIGYYRNDTLDKKALFYSSLSDTPFLEYNFDSLCPAPGCLTQVLVGGQPRTKWPGYESAQYPGYIAGVGGVGGLIPVQFATWSPPTPPYFTDSLYGNLTSFCVCGQNLYPSDTIITCELLSGVRDVPIRNSIKLFPNPSTNQCTLQMDGLQGNLSASVIDITGRTVIQLFNAWPLSYYNFSTENFSPGVYLVKINDESGRTSVVKLVKE